MRAVCADLDPDLTLYLYRIPAYNNLIGYYLTCVSTRLMFWVRLVFSLVTCVSVCNMYFRLHHVPMMMSDAKKIRLFTSRNFVPGFDKDHEDLVATVNSYEKKRKQPQ